MMNEQWPKAATILFPVTRGVLEAQLHEGVVDVYDGGTRLFSIPDLALKEANICVMEAEAKRYATRNPPTFPGLRCLNHGTGPVPPCPPHEANGVPHLLVRSSLGMRMAFEATGGGWVVALPFSNPVRLDSKTQPKILEWWVVQAEAG